MSAIAIPDLLGRFINTTLTFEELASLDGKELGPANSPYAVIGLTISKAVVKTNTHVNSSSRGVALRSTRFPPEANVSQIDLRFVKPQGAFGFFYSTSAPLRVKVLDSHQTVLEEDVFHDEEGYAGAIRAKAEIGIVRIVARSEALRIAETPFFNIDDLSFGRELKGGY